MKEQLKAKGFTTYAAYVRDCAERSGSAGVFNVSHMGSSRRYAQNRMRYALKEHSITVRMINENTTRVTKC